MVHTLKEYEEENMPGGVAFQPPPADRIGSIMAAINKAGESIPAGANGALVGVFNEHGANAALVVKHGGEFAVMTWIGKSWDGPLEYGAAVKVVF